MVAFLGDFFENAFVGLATGRSVVKIVSGVADVKNRIFAVADGLMNVEVQTNGAH